MNEINIKKLRKKIGVSQEKLAEMLGVHLRTIQNYENGGVIPKAKHAILHKLLCEVNADKALENTTVAPAAPIAPVMPVAPEQPPAVAIYKEMVAEQAGTIAALNREIGALKGENMSIARQNVELAAQNSVITEQNRELTAQNRELTALAEQNRALAEQNRALYMENHSIKKELEELRIFMGRPVVSPMPLSGVPEQQDAAGLMAAELAERYRRKPPAADTPAPTPIAPTRAKSPRVQARPR